MNQNNTLNPTVKKESFTVELEDPAYNPTGTRIDAYIAALLPGFTRSMIDSGNSEIVVNGKKVKKSRIVKNGDIVEFQYTVSPSEHLVPQDIPLQIVYEDSKVVVVNKKQGMVVHPAAGNHDGTLANALLHHTLGHTKKTDESGESYRPGIVHRLDKDTSGIMITAKDTQTHEFLSSQFKNRKTKKIYIALIKGIPAQRKGTVTARLVRDPRHRKKFTVTEDPAKGRDAVTDYRVLRAFYPGDGTVYSLVRLSPRTGRTHQLRVHMKSIGCPVLGDPLYSRKDAMFPTASLMLHALSLTITLPESSQEKRFYAPMPGRFKKILDYFLSNRVLIHGDEASDQY
jgi:23S rRNA pseudouridine1911/1915/1917 synthase